MPIVRPVGEMTQEHLQRIFEYLPEPKYAWVGLRGFDYSSIDQQASQLFPWIQIGGHGSSEPVVSMEQPTKERILQVHASSYGTEDMEHPNFVKPRIKVGKVYWDLKPDAEIDLFPGDFLTPGHIEIRCWGKEPEYLSKLRTELLKSAIRFDVKANQH